MSVFLETLVMRPSLVVRLRDDLTQGEASGFIEVSAGARRAFRNRSGYFVFVKLPPGPTQAQVVPALYLPEQLSTTLPRPDPLEPALDMTLLPNRLYPFPTGTTRVTGLVVGADGTAVSDAAIGGVGRPTRTGGDGRFVAYFRPLSEDDVTVVGADRRRIVKASDGTTTFALTIVHPSYQPETVAVSSLDEGAERHLGEIALTPI